MFILVKALSVHKHHLCPPFPRLMRRQVGSSDILAVIIFIIIIIVVVVVVVVHFSTFEADALF
jgi:hypothetical protein